MATNIDSDIKFGVTLKCGKLTHNDFDFKAVFFTNEREEGVTIAKSEMEYYEEDDFFIAIVPTRWLSQGEVLCRIIAQIADSDTEKGYRKEVLTIPTGVKIFKR